jgi:hypothetical protein
MARSRDEAGSRARKSREGRLDDAVEMTFPASDPVASGHATGTEPPRRSSDRRAPIVSKEDIERAAAKRG